MTKSESRNARADDRFGMMAQDLSAKNQRRNGFTIWKNERPYLAAIVEFAKTILQNQVQSNYHSACWSLRLVLALTTSKSMTQFQKGIFENIGTCRKKRASSGIFG